MADQCFDVDEGEQQKINSPVLRSSLARSSWIEDTCTLHSTGGCQKGTWRVDFQHVIGVMEASFGAGQVRSAMNDVEFLGPVWEPESPPSARVET
jgi:hypothetical protein